MQILFGVFILVILVVALYNRRKEKKQWLAEERRDENGGWIDKRAGERGTFGSLDEEMEQARKSVAREGRNGELTQLMREFAFNEYPGFHDLSDEQIKTWNTLARRTAYEAVSRMEELCSGKSNIPVPDGAPSGDAHVAGLKKQMLDFAYLHYPALLDLDLDQIRLFDRLCEKWAAGLIEKIREMQA